LEIIKCEKKGSNDVKMAKFKDISGQRFGRLVVIERTNRPENVKNGTYWLCKCDCGNEKAVLLSCLTNGNTSSCGCLKSEREDLSGMKFGRWTVIEFSNYDENRNLHWKCKCDCGTEKIVRGAEMKSGKSQSCGCLMREATHEKRFIDLTGKRFGKLIVIGIDHINKKAKGGYTYYWKCKCDCGNEKITIGKNLKSGYTNSCGCLQINNRRNALLKNGSTYAFNTLFYSYKRGAKQRGFNFELDENKFKELTQQNCYYCGCKPNQIKKVKSTSENYTYNGIDRLDSLEGYTVENSVSCCGTCNFAKREMSEQDFFTWIERVYNYSIKNKENKI
jgi:hypothetical protein